MIEILYASGLVLFGLVITLTPLFTEGGDR